MDDVEELIALCQQLRESVHAFPGNKYFGLTAEKLAAIEAAAKRAALSYRLPPVPGCSDTGVCKNFRSLQQGQTCPVCPNRKKARL
ncbi:hypothetical protein [Stenotrophomonas geniculata]|uniref:hypothetical protein n=1 Tax=Stenotrophomonas geniculata TaxID=86188 RepID=UPI00110FFDD7|nr:hypothetical protein [Stenotrophomonas geniculata]